jgi:hypothetical protein
VPQKKRAASPKIGKAALPPGKTPGPYPSGAQFRTPYSPSVETVKGNHIPAEAWPTT